MRVNFGSLPANTWARSFLAHFTAETKHAVADARAAALRVCDAAEKLFWEREPGLPDRQAASVIASCCLVLAAYRELREQVGESAAQDLVRAAIARVFQKPMRVLTRLWLWFFRDPLRRLRGDRWKNLSQRMYGASMEFDQDETQASVDLIVRRCAFHQFFVENGEPSLTRLFCAWDRNWMDLVDRSAREVRTERPSTISTGGDCCRFRILRGEPDSSDKPNDVVLVQLQTAAADQGVHRGARHHEVFHGNA